MAAFKRLVRRIVGIETDAVGVDRHVAIGADTGVYAASDILDPVLIRNIEVASRPTISPSPVFVLHFQTPIEIPWTDLDLGPWTADPQTPIPGTKGVASSVILYASIMGAGGIELYLRRKADTSDAGIFRHGSKFSFFQSTMVFLAVDADQLVQYSIVGKGDVELRFVGYFERPRVTA